MITNGFNQRSKLTIGVGLVTVTDVQLKRIGPHHGSFRPCLHTYLPDLVRPQIKGAKFVRSKFWRPFSLQSVFLALGRPLLSASYHLHPSDSWLNVCSVQP